jgi:mRNA-degrading endonuclease toxin of MazEF toxin-antitoxin module
MTAERVEPDVKPTPLPRQGEVWWVRFGDGAGRPFAVVSVNKMIDAGAPILGVPLGRAAVVSQYAVQLGLTLEGVTPMWARCELLRGVTARHYYGGPLGRLTPWELDEVQRKLAYVLGFGTGT